MVSFGQKILHRQNRKLEGPCFFRTACWDMVLILALAREGFILACSYEIVVLDLRNDSFLFFLGIVVKDPSVYDTLESVRSYIYGTVPQCTKEPLPSTLATGSICSSASCLSTAEDNEDAVYQTCYFNSDSIDEINNIPNKSTLKPYKSPLTRSSSVKCASPTTNWDKPKEQNNFASLPRKKHKSFRKRLLKFIPGLNRSLEEEASPL